MLGVLSGVSVRTAIVDVSAVDGVIIRSGAPPLTEIDVLLAKPNPTLSGSWLATPGCSRIELLEVAVIQRQFPNLLASYGPDSSAVVVWICTFSARSLRSFLSVLPVCNCTSRRVFFSNGEDDVFCHESLESAALDRDRVAACGNVRNVETAACRGWSRNECPRQSPRCELRRWLRHRAPEASVTVPVSVTAKTPSPKADRSRITTHPARKKAFFRIIP